MLWVALSSSPVFESTGKVHSSSKDCHLAAVLLATERWLLTPSYTAGIFTATGCLLLDFRMSFGAGSCDVWVTALLCIHIASRCLWLVSVFPDRQTGVSPFSLKPKPFGHSDHSEAFVEPFW